MDGRDIFCIVHISFKGHEDERQLVTPVCYMAKVQMRMSDRMRTHLKEPQSEGEKQPADTATYTAMPKVSSQQAADRGTSGLVSVLVQKHENQETLLCKF